MRRNYEERKAKGDKIHIERLLKNRKMLRERMGLTKKLK